MISAGGVNGFPSLNPTPRAAYRAAGEGGSPSSTSATLYTRWGVVSGSRVYR